MNSHKYIANSILKKFSHEEKYDKVIYYYDFSDNSIKSSKTTSFNTTMNFYTDENEQNLKRNDEEKIGNVIQELKKNYEQKNINFMLSNKQIDILKKHASYQILRDQSLYQLIRDIGKHVKTQPYYSQNKNLELINVALIFRKMSYKELANVFIEDESYNKSFFKSLNNVVVFIYFNYSNTDYVLNTSINTFKLKKSNYFISRMTLTPKISIGFCLKAYLKDYIKEPINYLVFDDYDDKNIFNYNTHVFKTAQNNQPHILVGSKEELESLRNWYLKG